MKAKMILPVILVLPAQAQSSITIDSMEPGELVRYPVVSLRGVCQEPTIRVGLEKESTETIRVIGGRYLALVQLKPGKNMVELRAGRDVTRMRLDYRPMKTPYALRAVYIVGQDEEPTYDSPIPGDRRLFREKFDTALKLLQSFTADAMKEAGYGRKTFPLELDADGKVVVHVLKHPRKGDELRATSGNDLWYLFYRWLEPQFPFTTNKVCALLGFSRYDVYNATARGHTALGGGGLGIFGTASMYTWPSSLTQAPDAFSNPQTIDAGKGFDDTANRGTYWASASTTIGAMLHEMGHTFGLPHSNDPREIMSRGFDLLNRSFALVEPPRRGGTETVAIEPGTGARFSPFFAARLNGHPWFQPDGKMGKPFATALAPSIDVDSAQAQIVVRAPYGLRVVGVEAEGRTPWFQEIAEGSTLMRFDRKLLQERIGLDKGFSVYAMDREGNEARLEQ